MNESKLKADKINKSANKGNSVIVKNLSLTAASFIQELEKLSDEKARKDLERYFKPKHRDHFIGVKNSVVNKLAGNFLDMPIKELEKMLNNDIHEVRAGAISVMDQLSRKKRTPAERRKELFDLFMKKTDRVNNWDLTDLGCMYMTGCYLFDKDRKVLYNLVKSENFWERRIAIVSTSYFIRQNDTADTFKISALLINDKEDLVQKGTGWMLRSAGDKNPAALRKFLDKYAATMPRTTLRYSLEKFSAKEKAYYMSLKKT